MLKQSEQGSKCKIHEVWYERQYFSDGKYREYCPKCEVNVLDLAVKEILSLSDEEFDKLMKYHQNGDIAKVLLREWRRRRLI